MKRWFIAVSMVVLLLFNTLDLSEAQRRGGGFGGGRGSSSSFGRSLSSPSSSSFGGRSSGVSRGYGGGYGGGFRMPFFFPVFIGGGGGGGFFGMLVTLMLLFVVFAIIIAIIKAAMRGAATARGGGGEWQTGPAAEGGFASTATYEPPASSSSSSGGGGIFGEKWVTVSVGLNLRRGQRYVNKLEQIMAEADFSEPAGRSRALHRLAKAVEQQDIADAYVIMGRPSRNKEQLGDQAEQLARKQMEYIGVQADTVNIATEDGNSVMLQAASGGPEKSDACVMTILVTIKESLFDKISGGPETQAMLALQRLYDASGRDFDAFYTFYVPNQSETLDAVTANRIFLDLKVAAERM